MLCRAQGNHILLHVYLHPPSAWCSEDTELQPRLRQSSVSPAAAAPVPHDWLKNPSEEEEERRRANEEGDDRGRQEEEEEARLYWEIPESEEREAAAGTGGRWFNRHRERLMKLELQSIQEDLLAAEQDSGGPPDCK